jgi:hypothetical protein
MCELVKREGEDFRYQYHGSKRRGAREGGTSEGLSVSMTGLGYWFVKSFIFTLLLHFCCDSSSLVVLLLSPGSV